MIAVADFTSFLNVDLPPVIARTSNAYCEIWSEVHPKLSGQAECTVLQERASKVLRARLQLQSHTVELWLGRSYRDSASVAGIHAPDAYVESGVLHLGASATWKRHPLLSVLSSQERARHVRESWDGYPILKEERLDAEGNTCASGLRPPQVGALHALAAHWSVKTSHAKIVLPTGTGKTDVMIAAAVLKKAQRVLAIVPSDALRTQILGKFEKFGVLKAVGAIPENLLNPVVSKLTKAPSTLEQVSKLRRANVVGSTTQMLLGMSNELLGEFLEWFDLVLFDEAHHLPATSWQRIQNRLPREAHVASFTATPYRNDGKRVSGELIYQFPLRLAQRLGYFRPISVARVEEYDPLRADEVIAKRAIAELRRDEEGGYRHIIFARARSVDHAETLERLYRSFASDLNPLALHSGVPVRVRKEIIASLQQLHSRIVICVDMLGEGFDLPALKIAALHDMHKSLPITLQFIGRFTRSAENVGTATAVINMAEPMAESAVAELFADDADWNELVPELSARAVRSEQDLALFLESMQSGYAPDDKKFDLSLIRPKTSVTMFRAAGLNPARLPAGLSKGSVVHQSWLSDDRSLLVFVSQDRVYPDWSFSKDAASFEWNLGVIAYDEERGLLYVNSTYGASRIREIARAIGGGDKVALVNGERTFRVFEGIHRAVLHNVGLYRRGGGLRFQMLAGLDIGEFVTSAVQAGSSKSNLFAIGYEDGRKTNVGASAKGRVWAMSPMSIPDWLVWAKHIAGKVVNDAIQTDSFLRFTLIPTEVSERPGIDVFTCVPPEELLPSDLHGERRISVYGDGMAYTQLHLSLDVESYDESSVVIAVRVGDNEGRLELCWSSGFAVRQVSGPRIRLLESGQELAIDEFLSSSPPALLLVDGSELVGKQHFRLPNAHPYTFHRDSILGIEWGATPITQESKWKNGQMRAASVQGFMIEKCLELSATFVFDDDDSGEVADIVVIDEKREARELEVSLYHCKYSGGSEPGARFKDLYEVCGQAVKSARIMNRPEALLAHMISREARLGGRQSRFERGTLGELRSLARRIGHYRMRLNVYVVQPGLSAAALTPELSSILAAAEGFVLEFTGRRLKVIGSM